MTDLIKIRWKGKILKEGESIDVGFQDRLIIGSTSISIERIFEKDLDTQEENLTQEKDFWVKGDPTSLQSYITSILLDEIRAEGVETDNLNSPEIQNKIKVKLKQVIASLVIDPKENKIEPQELERRVFDEVIGLGPLEEILSDKKITEIMVNKYNQIFIEQGGNLVLSKVNFTSQKALLSVIERIVSTVGRRIDTSSPICDARLFRWESC